MGTAEEKRVEKLVNDFLCSSNYTTSTTLLKNLESYNTLPKKLVDKIAANWKRNDQIVGCMGIPRKVDFFFKHHARNELAEEVRG